MFTGIVEELGTVEHIERLGNESLLLRVKASTVTSDAFAGASIAVSGVCLTVEHWDSTHFTAHVMAETVRHTTIGSWKVGSHVNLERAMSAQGRFGGHIVQGHVDGVTELVEREHTPQWDVLTFALPTQLAPWLVHKGSITVDGTSLTVSNLTATSFAVSLIPATLQHTTLGALAVGDKVNLEADVLAKYVASALAVRAGESSQVKGAI